MNFGKLKGALDRVPVPVRDALVVTLAGLLTWALDHIATFGLPAWSVTVLAAAGSWVALYLTNLTQQYGVGKPKSGTPVEAVVAGVEAGLTAAGITPVPAGTPDAVAPDGTAGL